MRREILFRAQVKYNDNHLFAGEWVEGSLIVKTKGVFIYVIEKDEFDNVVREFEVEVIPETVGQFIGEYNSTRIFEDDVDQYGDIIKWNERMALFTRHNKEGRLIGYPMIPSLDNIKITDNIHDNPTLINNDN